MKTEAEAWAELAWYYEHRRINLNEKGHIGMCLKIDELVRENKLDRDIANRLKQTIKEFQTSIGCHGILYFHERHAMSVHFSNRRCLCCYWARQCGFKGELP